MRQSEIATDWAVMTLSLLVHLFCARRSYRRMALSLSSSRWAKVT